MGQLEKNLDTLPPSRVAEVIRTFKLEERILTNLFISPNNMSLTMNISRNEVHYMQMVKQCINTSYMK